MVVEHFRLLEQLLATIMNMSNLFGPDVIASGLPGQSSVHVSFRAGILTHDHNSNRVTPDPRPGTFQIWTSPEDELTHIQWKPRDSSDVEHDLILIRGEIEMKQVASCPPSARVYVLKWRDSDARLFLWMQERDPSVDQTNVSLVNSILENGPMPQQVQ